MRAYVTNNNVQIYISVEETFDNDHRVVSQRGTSIKGKFTFSAADSGEHRICFSPIGAATHSGWLPGGQQAGAIRFDLDLAIGETSKIESDDKDKMQDLQQKVRDLNARLQDIRREQVFQRVRDPSPFFRGRLGRRRSVSFLLTSTITGAGGRVQRSIRVHQRQGRPLDADPSRRAGRDVRMAAVAPAGLLHQAEADLSDGHMALARVRGIRLCFTHSGRVHKVRWVCLRRLAVRPRYGLEENGKAILFPQNQRCSQTCFQWSIEFFPVRSFHACPFELRTSDISHSPSRKTARKAQVLLISVMK